MAVEKTAPMQQVHSISRSQSIAIGKTSNDTHTQQTIAEFSKELTRKLNRRGCRLRVKRRRGDTNGVYAEKLLVEIEKVTKFKKK